MRPWPGVHGAVLKLRSQLKNGDMEYSMRRGTIAPTVECGLGNIIIKASLSSFLCLKKVRE